MQPRRIVESTGFYIILFEVEKVRFRLVKAHQRIPPIAGGVFLLDKINTKKIGSDSKEMT